MKPLSQAALKQFLDRFDNFKGSELRSLDVIDPFEIKLVIAAQDKARGYDWITIELYFSSVEAANLVEDNQLSFIDMEDGLNIIFSENSFAFGIGDCYNISNIKSSPLYIISKTLKFEEGQF